MATVHETEENLVRSATIQLNKANLMGLSDAIIAALSPATVAGLKTAVTALPVHETFKNYTRQINNGIQKMADLKDAGGTAVLTDAEVASSTTFALLRGEVTEHSSYSTIIATLDFGEQAMAS